MGTSNLKGINLLQGVSQQIISQYANNTSFTVKVEEASVDYLVGILHKFGTPPDLKSIGKKNVAYWCGQGQLLE